MFFMIGQKIKVTTDKETKRGRVIANHHYFYVIQHKFYKEAYKKSDIKMGLIRFELA